MGDASIEMKLRNLYFYQKKKSKTNANFILKNVGFCLLKSSKLYMICQTCTGTAAFASGKKSIWRQDPQNAIKSHTQVDQSVIVELWPYPTLPTLPCPALPHPQFEKNVMARYPHFLVSFWTEPFLKRLPCHCGRRATRQAVSQ